MINQASVMFVCPRFHTNYRGWVRQLVEAGWDVSAVVIHLYPGEDHNDIQLSVCGSSQISKLLQRIQFFKGENNPNSGPSLFWAFKKLREEDPTVVVIRGRATLLSVVFLLASILTRTPKIIYDQEPLYSGKREGFSKRFFDRIVFRAGMTPVLGAGARRRDASWSLVPFEAADPVVKAPKTLPGRSYVSIGKFNSPRKRFEFLLEAAAGSLTSADSLTIIGTSPDGRVPDQLRKVEESIGNLNVSFELNVPHTMMAEKLSQFDVFVLPARDEPASVSVVEALGQGLFVVCSDTCGTKDYIPPGRGTIFRTDEIEDLRRILIMLGSETSIPVDHSQVQNWLARQAEVLGIVDFLESFIPI